MPDIPNCPGPDPRPHGPARFTPPPGAVDCHAHVIGLPPEYPFEPARSYNPPAAPAGAYLEMLDAAGMARGVLVQVSVHGADNRLLVRTLKANPARLRGVAVVPIGLPDREYAGLRAAGVVGLRLNVLFGGGIGLTRLEEYGALCRELGWHLELLLDVRSLPDIMPRLARLHVPFVVDHMGHVPVAAGLHDPGLQGLISLVRDGACWVKLSGAYRVSASGPPYRDTVPLAQALLAAGPERCVWGSDWPHVATYGPMPNVGDLLDLLAEWVPDPAQRQAVLVDNPVRLYGFT